MKHFERERKLQNEERERKFQNEERERRQRDIDDSWLNWTLSAMLLFCCLAVIINEVMR